MGAECPRAMERGREGPLPVGLGELAAIWEDGDAIPVWVEAGEGGGMEDRAPED